MKQAIVDDITPEALGNVLQDNPKGALWLTDELASLLLNLGRYKQQEGGAKARLLSGHSCGPWKTNRVNGRNFHIPKACLAIFGGVQPGMLQKIFQAGVGGIDEESGFLPRFLFILAVATTPAYFSSQTFSYQSIKVLEGIAAHLWAWDIEYDAAGNEIEKIVPVSDEARALYIAWHDAIAREAFISTNAAVLKKAQAHALRICLLFHSLDAALARADGMNLIPRDTMQRALRLMDWLLEHQRQCWIILSPGKKAKQASPLETAIMQVIVENATVIDANGGKITLGELASFVKKKPGMAQVPNERIGKIAASLKLRECKINGDRAREVTVEQIEAFKTAVHTVQSVQTPAPVANSVDENCPDPVCEPSVPVQPSTFEESEPQSPPVQIHNGTITPARHPVTFTTAEDLFATLPADVLRKMTDMCNEAWRGFYPKDSSRDSCRTV